MAPASTAPEPIGRLLIGACGSAAVTMLPNYLISISTEVGCRITVLMTAAAQQFLPARTIGLFADEVLRGDDVDAGFVRNHVQLAAEHDLILVLPATAHVLALAAGGQGRRLRAGRLVAVRRAGSRHTRTAPPEPTCPGPGRTARLAAVCSAHAPPRSGLRGHRGPAIRAVDPPGGKQPSHAGRADCRRPAL